MTSEAGSGTGYALFVFGYAWSVPACIGPRQSNGPFYVTVVVNVLVWKSALPL